MASWSSVTGLPWQARRTPLTILSRVNGSVAPLRLATIKITVSWVVNRRPHDGQDRRRRIAVPSSAVRLSMTLLSGFLQYGQNTDHLLYRQGHDVCSMTTTAGETTP